MHKRVLVSPPLLYQLFIVFMLIIWGLPTARFIHFPINLIGIGVFLAGAYLALTAKKLFKRTDTPIRPGSKPVRLHSEGVFKFTRNPMYLGIVVGLIGIAILTGKWINLIFPLLYFLIMDRVFIKYEERNLEREFGEAFLLYKQKTRRWI